MLQFQDHFFYKTIKKNCIVLKSLHKQTNLVLDITFTGISTKIFKLRNKIKIVLCYQVNKGRQIGFLILHSWEFLRFSKY